MNQDIKFQLIELLKQRGGVYGAYSVSVNKKQHYTRCPYCGDSKNLSHAHMSIKIDVDTDYPIVFRCLKCDMKGLVTEDVIAELNLSADSEFLKNLKAYTKKSMKLANLTNLEMEKYSVPTYIESTLNNSKLDYINKRLGTDISYQEAHDMKILLNLFDFMTLNEIETIDGLSFNSMKFLNKYYIGFLSTNNNCIIFRDITNTQKYRYFKCIINQKNVNPDTFYSMPNVLPLMYTNDINVHMAEGIFDILSIQQNLIKSKENNLFYATCGFGGITLIKYLIHHGINTGINFHIYSDNDKTDTDHKKYLFTRAGYTEWLDHIYIHRNKFSNEKDYGVPLSNICDRKIQIK